VRYVASAVLLIALVACDDSSSTDSTEDPELTTAATAATTTTTALPTPLETFAAAPDVPSGALSAEVAGGVDRLLENLYTEDWDLDAIGDLADLGDPRVAWLLADLMRFYQQGLALDQLVSAFSELTGARPIPGDVEFVSAMNSLIAWDLPAWDGYPEAKTRVYVPIEAFWEPFFDQDHGVDWRIVTWGGVLADTRPLGDNGPCNCIPALDFPETTDAAGGDWYPDDEIVFGIVVEGEAIALPKQQMEVHEMVNLTLGGRELGIPYCTLCGSAQAYFVDSVPGVDRVVLRTSGLLQRSNKLMYDLTTHSAIDTFTGVALTGPLGADGVELEQVSVVASTWGDWKRAHPETRVLASDGGIGRSYREDPLGGRDDAGPIFPIGDVDPRLPIQERVIGVIDSDGTAIAFPVDAVTAALADDEIEYEGLTVRLEDAIRVYDASGAELTSHEAFWFAWSQFHEGTLVWSLPSG
jgi:hypothetical protein